MQDHSGLSLLINGREAFPEILRCIDGAARSIEIHMFIWRADAIGMDMADAVLRAADRGVEVSITVDRYALSLERCEECGVSFFHQQPTLWERFQSFGMHCVYRLPIRAYGQTARHTALLQRMLHHERIQIHRDQLLADHSKYYIIDDSVLFLGGINIEDKENGSDLSGRVYYDYMVKLTGADAVAAFRHKTEAGADLPGPYRFAVNSRRLTPNRFELREEYLNIIRLARQDLVIVMAYFSLQRDFLDAILGALDRGVRVTILLSAHANFQTQSNLRTAKVLLRRSGGRIRVFLSPRMIHTKLVGNEQTISLGSCNITRRAFRQLCELNLTLAQRDSVFCRRLADHVRDEIRLAAPVQHPSQIQSCSLLGWIEGLGC